MEKILIRAPRDLKEALKACAKERGLTVNAVVLQILWAWVRKERTS